MRIAHAKLVRDRIPEIIASSGSDYYVEQLGEQAFIAALRAKVVEEAREVAAAPPEALLAELADLSEVMGALLEASGHSWEALRALQAERRAARGGFEARLWLHWVELGPEAREAVDDPARD